MSFLLARSMRLFASGEKFQRKSPSTPPRSEVTNAG
jgi:hypothetical protein